MASRGFLRKYNALLLKRRKGSLVPLIPLTTGSDLNKSEVDVFSSAFWPGITPQSATLTINGGNPAFYQTINLTPVALSINVFGNVPTVISTEQIEFVGRTYKVSPVFTLVPSKTIEFTGEGYGITLESLGGFLFSGSGQEASLSATLLPDYNINFTGVPPGISLEAELAANYDIQFTGRGYRITPEFLGGFYFSGSGYSISLSASSTASELIQFVGHGYAINPVMSVSPVIDIQFTGTSYGISFQRDIAFVGRGYNVAPAFSVSFNAAYAEAFVMNILTKTVTRYTNYPFMHLAKIGQDYYGFKSDGLYKITGNLDLTDPVTDVTSITTKATDFGEFQAKRVPYLYANADTTFKVTAIIDDVLSVQQDAIFAGRKVKLGRGGKGRYWAFQLDGITKLQGLEFLPEQRQRRV